jgi:hypothetical protein
LDEFAIALEQVVANANSSPVKDSRAWEMFRSRLLEKLTHLLHQLRRIDVFHGAEFSPFLGSAILVHIELEGVVPLVQNLFDLGVKR